MSDSMILMVIVAAATFVLVMAIWGIALLLFGARQTQRQQVLHTRLGLEELGIANSKTLRLWHEGREVTTSVVRASSLNLTRQFEGKCRSAGWSAPAGSVALAVSGLAVGAAALALLFTGKLLLGLGAAMAVGAGFWFYLQRRIARRRILFESQLIDALELAARSLRVGHPLVSAFRLISEEMDAPMGPLFGGIVQQQELGVPLDKAVQGAALQSNSDDMSLFATSIVIQLRSGGNLADMMERVASVMRDRMRLTRRVRVLIAQTQISKKILMSLPVFVFFMLNLVNPEYMRPLYATRGGTIILAMAGGGLALGWLVINRLSVIRY